jgi:hypothetical protein
MVIGFGHDRGEYTINENSVRKNLIGDSHEKISAGNCFERSEFQLDGIAAEDNSGRKNSDC